MSIPTQNSRAAPPILAEDLTAERLVSRGQAIVFALSAAALAIVLSVHSLAALTPEPNLSPGKALAVGTVCWLIGFTLLAMRLYRSRGNHVRARPTGWFRRAMLTVLPLAALWLLARPLSTVVPGSMEVLRWLIFVCVAGSLLTTVYKCIQVSQSGHGEAIQVPVSKLKRPPFLIWPTFTVLVPLFREITILPYLLEHLRRLDYPTTSLDIRLLVEADDDELRQAIGAIGLDSHFSVIVCPERYPRTKPSACNIGLVGAKGAYVVIYDAEDIPDPLQLKKAAWAFHEAPHEVVCLQSQLQYHNPHTNWLTLWFAAEYAFHFGIALLGLDRLGGPIPLGGTSNIFRLDALVAIGAWDSYNVTEDADLGVRIARKGWRVRTLNSVTEEEATSKVHNWYRQRSRWIKGFYQTWLVHMRHPWRLFRDLGLKQFLSFQLNIGFVTVTGLVNPLFWMLTIAYVIARIRGNTAFSSFVDELFPPLSLYMGGIGLVLGNLLPVYFLLMGGMDRGIYRSFWKLLFVPIYWVLMSLANLKAISQLVNPRRRSHWELSPHGFVTPPVTEPASLLGEAT